MQTTLEEWNCSTCGRGDFTIYRLQLIPSSNREGTKFYGTQVAEYCANCGKYRRFVALTDILVKRFNQRLEIVTIRAKEGRDG